MKDFLKLWIEFKLGVKSLNYHLIKGGTPFYAKERERFQKQIVEPMDAKWLELTQDERDSFKENLKRT